MAGIRKGHALRMAVGITTLVLLMVGGTGAVTLNSPTLLYPGSPINMLQPTPIGGGWIQNPANGQHEIYVLISPFNKFLEKDYTNNIATKIINISGTYLGAYLGCGSSDLSCENISEFNQKMGKPHSIFVRYVDIKDSKNPAHWAWAEEVKKNGAMPMFVYDPWDGLGAINTSDMEYFASKIKELNTTVFIVFGHEMNIQGYPWGNQPGNYTNKFKEVAEIFHSIAPNVKMVWLPNQNWGYPWGWTNYGDGYSEYYPEGTGVYGDYVDWVGLNFYDKDWDENNMVTPGFFTANIKSGQNNTDFYQMFAVGKNKSMLIGETGAFDPNKDPTASGERKPLNETEEASYKNEWVEQIYNVSTLEEEFPRLNAIIYFHTNKTETIDTQNHRFTNIVMDYRIPESPNIYKTLISNSYFIGAENATEVVSAKGDVNRNGVRDTGDATLILRYVVDLPIPSEYNPILPIGDMNCNGIIDTGDATLVLRDIVGLDIPRCWE